MVAFQRSVVSILSSTFSSNTAATAGAVMALAVSLLRVLDSNFTRNYAQFADGGALAITGDNSVDNRAPAVISVSECYFSRNVAMANAAALSLLGSLNVDITQSSFSNNLAQEASHASPADTELSDSPWQSGSAIISGAKLNISHCLLQGNHATEAICLFR